MTNRFIRVTLLLAVSALFLLSGCDKSKNEGESTNTEEESAEEPKIAHKKSEDGYLKMYVGGAEKNFDYIPIKPGPSLAEYSHSNSKKNALIRMERFLGESELSDKFYIRIHNLYLEDIKEFPYEVGQKGSGEVLKMSYMERDTKRYQNIFRNSSKKESYSVVITGYENDVLRGTFKGSLSNRNLESLKVTRGEFEVKLKVRNRGKKSS